MVARRTQAAVHEAERERERVWSALAQRVVARVRSERDLERAMPGCPQVFRLNAAAGLAQGRVVYLVRREAGAGVELYVVNRELGERVERGVGA